MERMDRVDAQNDAGFTLSSTYIAGLRRTYDKFEGFFLVQ